MFMVTVVLLGAAGALVQSTEKCRHLLPNLLTSQADIA